MKKCLSIIGLFTFLLPLAASAVAVTITPTSFAPGDETVLHTSITASATTITLEPLYKYVNGVKTKGCINTAPGFAIINDINRTEWVSYGTKSCSSTFITTLTDVRRGLSPTTASFNAGTGMAWDAGSKFRVIDYPLLYNYALYRDIPVTTTNSGAILCGSTHQPCFITNGVTTTQRDAFTFGKAADMYPMIFNTTTGVMQYWNGGAWIAFGSGASLNATETSGGKAELATVADQIAKTQTGDSGAPLVLQPKYLTGSGAAHGNNNTVSAGRIPILNGSGVLATSLGGLGRANATSGSLLLGQGSGAVAAVAPGTVNNVLISNGSAWVSGLPRSFVVGRQLSTQAGDSITTGTATNFQSATSLSGGTLLAKDVLDIYASGRVTTAAANKNILFSYRLGTTDIVANNSAGNDRALPASMVNRGWEMRVRCTVRSIVSTTTTLSCSGNVKFGDGNDGGVTTSVNTLQMDFSGNATVTVDSTAALTMIPRIDWTTDATNTIIMDEHVITITR